MADRPPSDNFMRALLQDTLGRAIMGDHSPSTLTREQVNAEPCKCVRCSWCRGTGRYRGDDIWDESEPCEECGGLGITEACGRCEYLEELDREP